MSIELGKVKKAYDDIQKAQQNKTESTSKLERIREEELELMNKTVETNKLRIIELQRENELLQAELYNVRNETPKVDERRVAELEEDIMDLQARFDQEKTKTKSLVDLKDQEISQLKVQLAQFKDSDKVVNELKVLKGQIFAEAFDPQQNQSLEYLLGEKNKKLQVELTRMENLYREKDETIKGLEMNRASLQKKINDLERTMSQYEESASIATTSTGTDPAAASVLLNQRDRLKSQKDELEQRLRQLSQILESQKLESDRLQKDNIKLYERISQLEAINTKTSMSRDIIDAEVGDPLHHPYSPAYEDHNCSSFKSFIHNKVIRGFRSLAQNDRTIWRFGRIFLTNKFIRRFTISYFVILHVVMLYLLLRGDSRNVVH